MNLIKFCLWCFSSSRWCQRSHPPLWRILLLCVIFGGKHLAIESRRTEGCHFPAEWEGIWFQSTVRPYLTIDSQHMSTKGKCIDYSGEKFILSSAKNCFKCLVFHQKHRNVLQYKETLGCSSESDLATLCGRIAGDANLYTLFRVDSTAISCPFHGPFSFSYNNGKGECKEPQSELEPCTDPSRLVFHYQACPNVRGSELKDEELECQATWKEGSLHYLVGKLTHRHALGDEDKFRCFVFQYISPSTPDEGLYLAQSGDATCNGLFSPREGSRALTLTKGMPKTGCNFPNWLTSQREWTSLHGDAMIHVTANETTSFRFINSTTYSVESALSTSTSSYVIRKESFFVCHRHVRTHGHRRSRLILYQSSGCKSGFVCTDITRKAENVLKIKFGSMTRTLEYACDESQFQTDTSHLLLAAASNHTKHHSHRLPLSGVYEISPKNFSSNFFRHSMNFFDSRQQLSAAVRAGQTASDLLSHSGHEKLSTMPQVDNVDLCPDERTKKVVTVVAGCRVPHRDDLQIRSTCKEEISKVYTCSYSWMEESVDSRHYYLIFKSRQHHTSNVEPDSVCFRVTSSTTDVGSDRTADNLNTLSLVMLDDNCELPSRHESRQLSSLEMKSKSEKYTLSFDGDCSTVSGSHQLQVSLKLFSILAVLLVVIFI